MKTFDLSNANLAESNLTNVDLKDANLSGAHLLIGNRFIKVD